MYKLIDSQYMTASEKAAVLRNWETFLKHGMQRQHFTKALYHHLSQHCGHIAHYDINGFHDAQCGTGARQQRFLKQFDATGSSPCLNPLGGSWWLTGEYADINLAMIDVGLKYIPKLKAAAAQAQRESDVAQASALLARHGMKVAD